MKIFTYTYPIFARILRHTTATLNCALNIISFTWTSSASTCLPFRTALKQLETTVEPGTVSEEIF